MNDTVKNETSSNTFQFREHRGSLAESIQTKVILNNRDELIAHCTSILSEFQEKLTPEQLEVKLYDSNYDSRIAWDTTYSVTIAGKGVIGFTDKLI
jgi:hypothetical protein